MLGAAIVGAAVPSAAKARAPSRLRDRDQAAAVDGDAADVVKEDRVREAVAAVGAGRKARIRVDGEEAVLDAEPGNVGGEDALLARIFAVQR